MVYTIVYQWIRRGLLRPHPDHMQATLVADIKLMEW
jgi:hypothetical protein